MKKLLLPLLLLLAMPVFGQAAYYQNNAYTAAYINGTHVVTVMDGAQVEVCTTVTGVCTQVKVYSDQAMQNPITQPFPVDQGGNFGFFVPAGTYSYWILDSVGTPLIQLPFTVGGSGGGSSGITQLTGDVTASGSGSVPATLATVNAAPGSCGDATHVCQITTNGKGLTTGQTAVAISTGSGGVPSLNSLAGALNITGGSNISVTPSGSNISISSTVPLALSGQTVNYLPKATTATTSIGPSIISDDGTNATVHGGLSATNVTDSALSPGDCVQAAAGGLLGTTGAPCGAGTGGGATFPSTNGLVENTSTTASTTATSAQVVAALNLSPTSQLVTALIPTLNQSTTGNAATATALAVTPTVCSAGNAPTGILANGNATGCQPVGGGSGAVSSVSNSDGSLTVTPTTGAVIASLNLAHANIWTAQQSAPSFAATGTGATLNATEGAEATPVSGHDILNASSANHCMEYSSNGSAFACLGTGGSSGVSSFNGRTGAVVPASGDYTAAQVTNAADTNVTAEQDFSGPITAPSVNGMISVASFEAKDPSGCTVAGTAYATPLECAWATVAQNAINGTGVTTLYIPAGKYSFASQLVIPNTTHVSTMSVIGAGSGATELIFTGTLASGGIIEHPGPNANRLTLQGFRVTANMGAPYAIELYDTNYSTLRDIIYSDAGVNLPAGSNTLTLYSVRGLVSGSISQGNHAWFIPTISSGAVTALTPASPLSSNTVTAGGSGYTSTPTITYSGTCYVTPTGNVNLSSGAVSSISITDAGVCEAGLTASITGGGGTGATVTPVMAATGGSGYTPANTVGEWYGHGSPAHPDKPCDTLPTATFTFSSGAITGATVTSGGVNCQAGSTLFQVYDGPAVPYGLVMGASDSVAYDLYESIGSIGGVDNTGSGNSYFKYHAYYVPIGMVNTNSVSVYGTELDSTREYGFETSFHMDIFGTVIGWDGNGPYPGAALLHTTNGYAENTLLDGLTCSDSQTGGGYQSIIDSSLGAVSLYDPTLKLNGQNVADCSPVNPSAQANFVNVAHTARLHLTDTSGSGDEITVEAPTLTGNQTVIFPSTGGTLCTTSTCGGSSFITSLTTNGTSGAAQVSGGVLNIPQYAGGGSMTWPTAAGIAVYAGSQTWGTSLTAPAGTIVGTTDTQTLTNKTLDGVAPATMAYLDATSSIQTQLNAKPNLSSLPLSCQPGLGDGLNAIPAGTYLQTTCKNETGQTWTISAIRCVANGGSSTCNVTNGAGTALLTAAVTGTSSYANGTQSATTTIAAGDYLKVTFVADGTTKQIGIDVAGTY